MLVTLYDHKGNRCGDADVQTYPLPDVLIVGGYAYRAIRMSDLVFYNRCTLEVIEPAAAKPAKESSKTLVPRQPRRYRSYRPTDPPDVRRRIYLQETGRLVAEKTS